jgi:hypothetical protein
MRRLGRLREPAIRVWRALLVCGACAVILSAASVSLLALAIAFSDDEQIQEHLLGAVENGSFLPQSYPMSPYGHVGHSNDMFTDCVAFGTNLSNRDDSLLYRMAASPFVGRTSPENDSGFAAADQPCETLVAALEKGDVKANAPYLRFWHGYQVYMRPLLSLVSLENFRRITATLFLAALVVFAAQAARWFGPLAWPVTLLPFFLVGDFLSVPAITTHALSLTWIFLSAALVPIILERSPRARTIFLPAFVFCAGMIGNFVSFLLNPPLAPALIAFLAIAGASRDRSSEAARNVLYAAGLVALWFAGFFTEWIAKLVFASAVLGLDAVYSEVAGQMGAYAHEGLERKVGLLGATWRNIAPNWIFFGVILLSMASAFSIVGYGTWRGRFSRDDVKDFLAMLTPLMAIVVWVEANFSHSEIHVGFVNRSFLLFSVIPLLAVLLIWRRGVRARP